MVDRSKGCRNSGVMHTVCWLSIVVDILRRMVQTRCLRIRSGMRCVHGRIRLRGSVQHVVRMHGQLLVLVEILDSGSLILGSDGLVNLGICCAVISIGADAVKLEANTG